MLSRIREADARRLVVGYSGGIDSHTLLHVVLAAGFDAEVHALHINHGIAPDSDDWQRHCEGVCRELGIGLTSKRVNIATSGNVEESARHARYEAFADFLRKHDLLLLAHHADDQVETALLTLFRGGDQLGLGGMPVERSLGRSRLLRPLLDVSRARIEAYAVEHGFEWIEDASNEDTSLNRNYIRHRVIPVIQARWPDVTRTLLRAVERDSGYSQLIDYIGEIDLATALGKGVGAAVAGLKALPLRRRNNAIRFWLASFGLPFPGDAMLTGELDSLLDAGPDATPLLSWQEVCLRRFDDTIYLTSSLPEFDDSAVLHFAKDKFLDTGIGRLSAEAVEGRGVAVENLGGLEVRFRHGGEKIRLNRNRTLKNVFQESGVPPWLRDCIPLLCLSGEIVAVPALPAWNVPMRVASHFQAGVEEKGFEFTFVIPDQPYSH